VLENGTVEDLFAGADLELKERNREEYQTVWRIEFYSTTVTESVTSGATSCRRRDFFTLLNSYSRNGPTASSGRHGILLIVGLTMWTPRQFASLTEIPSR
jgi:hypothetical protein